MSAIAESLCSNRFCLRHTTISERLIDSLSCYNPTHVVSSYPIRPPHTNSALMATHTQVSPFFEPGAPPPALRLLTTETEFLPNTSISSTILTQDLPAKRANTKVQDTITTYRRKTPVVSFRSVSPASTHSSSVSEASDSLGNSTNSDSGSDDGLIPKPDGEAGRPSRGGYNLELELSWDVKRFRALKVKYLLSFDKTLRLTFHIEVYSQEGG